MIEQGTPAQTIVNVAKQNECDLIIRGSHAETNSNHWKIRSVADKVLKASSDFSNLLVTTKDK